MRLFMPRLSFEIKEKEGGCVYIAEEGINLKIYLSMRGRIKN